MNDVSHRDSPEPLYTLSQFRESTMEFLRAHGYGSPRVNTAGQILFESNELTFCVFFDPDDVEYVRLCLPNFYHCNHAALVPLAVAVGTDCQQRYKLGQYTVTEEWVSAQVPLLMDTPEFWTQDRLFRLTQSLRTMAQHFVETMRGAVAAARV